MTKSQPSRKAAARWGSASACSLGAGPAALGEGSDFVALEHPVEGKGCSRCGLYASLQRSLEAPRQCFVIIEVPPVGGDGCTTPPLGAAQAAIEDIKHELASLRCAFEAMGVQRVGADARDLPAEDEQAAIEGLRHEVRSLRCEIGALGSQRAEVPRDFEGAVGAGRDAQCGQDVGEDEALGEGMGVLPVVGSTVNRPRRRGGLEKPRTPGVRALRVPPPSAAPAQPSAAGMLVRLCGFLLVVGVGIERVEVRPLAWVPGDGREGPRNADGESFQANVKFSDEPLPAVRQTEAGEMRGNLIEAPAVEGADEYGEEDGVDDVLALNWYVGEAARRVVAATGRKRRMKVCTSFSEWNSPLLELLGDCRGRWGGGVAAAIEGRSSRLGGPSSLRALVAEAAPVFVSARARLRHDVNAGRPAHVCGHGSAPAWLEAFHVLGSTCGSL